MSTFSPVNFQEIFEGPIEKPTAPVVEGKE
jgi:hypothetical protein